MNEREIRRLLSAIRANMDRRVRALLRKTVIPTAVGAGLALGACGDDSSPKPDAKPDTIVTDQGPAADGAPDNKVADSGKADTVPHWDFLPPPPPYMAPDAAPLYQSLQDRA